VRAKLRVFMLADIRGGYKTLFLTDIARPPHADKAALDEIVSRFTVQRQRIN
jgi:hypothetical protein